MMHLAWQIIKQVWGGSAMMPHLHKNCTLALSSDPLISKAWITQFSSRAAGRKPWRKLKKQGLWWLTITQGPAGGAARHVPEQTARGVRTGSVWRLLAAAVSQGSYPAGSLAPKHTGHIQLWDSTCSDTEWSMFYIAKPFPENRRDSPESYGAGLAFKTRGRVIKKK